MIGPTKFRVSVRAKDNDDRLTFIFYATSSKAVLMWYNALIINWEAGRAYADERALNIPRQIPAFWRRNFIRVEMMNEIADSGDIIFFSSNQWFPGLQRWAT